ncbi:MAG: ABC-F family ATP-binding cassette domain-containing protein, partial [Methylocystaceae bacterium]
MNILSVENLGKSYGEKVLFSAVNFGIDENDKIGLLGVNGTGKSTFLRVIVGLEPPDQGSIIKGNQITIEYLLQNPYMDDNATVLQQVFKGSSPVMQVLRRYEEATDCLNARPDDKDLQRQLIALCEQMDSLDAWQLESEAKSVLTRLGIYQFDARIGTLSGGQKKRVALASALITPADLLVLDEPTNHIDNDTVDWLEQYLKRRKGALIMVTHDRYFLDRVVGRILELEQGSLYSYAGNYGYFLQTKLEREEQAQVSERKRQRLLSKELEWIRKGPRARTTKQKARIQRFEQLQEGVAPLPEGKLELGTVSSRLGKQVIELEHISKSFAGENYITDFSYVLLRDDRIGIVGPNGIGKSTLLNIIIGKMEPDAGEVKRGKTVKVGYFTQETPELDESQRAIDYIKEIAEYLPLAGGGTISASQMLERFLFPGELQWVPVNKLSGGEKRRLYLARILMEAPNVLILDEPTNDLDIETLTVLEDYLDDFPGAIIIASHDRYFLDRTTLKTFAYLGNGMIIDFPGNYSDYRESVKDNNPKDVGTSLAKPHSKKSEWVRETKSDNQTSNRKRFTFKEQREYDQIDALVSAKESELKLLAIKITAASTDYN